MTTQRMNIDFPSEDYSYLKMLCAEKGVSIKDFVVPIILKAIEEEEEDLLIRKAERRFKNTKQEDLIPMEEAMQLARWDVKKI